MNEKKKLNEKYEVGLMIVSIVIILALMIDMTLYPEAGKAIGAQVMHALTYTFGSVMQFFTVIVLIFLVALAFSKYGNIRFGNCKPEFKTMSWVAMMFLQVWVQELFTGHFWNGDIILMLHLP